MFTSVKKQQMVSSLSKRNLQKLSEMKRSKLSKTIKKLNYQNLIFPSFSDMEGKLVVIHFNKNYRYEGEINEYYEPHGDGNLYYPNGDFYFGEFVNGKKEGIGEYHYYDGTIYIGNWFDDVKHGEGCMISTKDGWRFNGNFAKDNFINGKFSSLKTNEDYDEELFRQKFLGIKYSSDKKSDKGSKEKYEDNVIRFSSGKCRSNNEEFTENNLIPVSKRLVF